MYIRAHEDLRQILESDVSSRMLSYPALGQSQAAGTPKRKSIKHLICSESDRKRIESIIGKTVSEDELRIAVSTAVKKAVSLTLKAAMALETTPRSNATKTLFREIFGTFPEFAPQWRRADTAWKDSGELIAIRLRRAVDILVSGQIKYYSWACPGGDRDPTTYEAANHPPGKYIICLGKGFWENLRNAEYSYMGMTLLHEALHIYYSSVITGKHEGRYGNANCYQRFVPEINGLYLYPDTEKACPTLLRQGSVGPEVCKVQGLLNNWITRFTNPNKPSEVKVDGIFGRNTADAIKAFQRVASLKEKGVVGATTWRELLQWK